MKYKIVILLLVLLVLGLSTAYAGNEARVGTAGALELNIPYGSRGSAMGGAVLSTVTGVESMYWNPAGLGSLEGTEVMFTHIPYFADIDVNYVGLASVVEGFGTIGFGAKVVQIGDMKETTEEFPDGTGKIFSPTLSVFNVSYAKVLNANVQFGINAKFIHENVLNVQATGAAFDFGFVYNPRWNGLALGIVIKNYGTEMQYTGIGFDREVNNRPLSANSAKFELPSSFNFGVSYDIMNEDLNYASFSGTFQSNNFSQDVWNGGIEYVYDGKYSLRGGYNYSDRSQYIYGASFGAGVKIPVGDMDLSLEYTWTQTDVFDNNQYFTFKANF